MQRDSNSARWIPAERNSCGACREGEALFTGIIEELGKVRELRPAQHGASIAVEAAQMAPSLKIGDSVAVNGVCLTVARLQGSTFTCDLSSETLHRSSFNQAREGWMVNLERPVLVGGRLGGHIVQGHVDGVGRLVSSTDSGAGRVMEYSFPRELERYLVHKGSIAVDGISLTIAALGSQSFKVAVIPHTSEATNIRYLHAGAAVNLEVDLLGKYFERFFQLGLLEGRPSHSTGNPLWQESS